MLSQPRCHHIWMPYKFSWAKRSCEGHTHLSVPTTIGKSANSLPNRSDPNEALRGANGCGVASVVPLTQVPSSQPKCLKLHGLLCAWISLHDPRPHLPDHLIGNYLTPNGNPNRWPCGGQKPSGRWCRLTKGTVKRDLQRQTQLMRRLIESWPT